MYIGVFDGSIWRQSSTPGIQVPVASFSNLSSRSSAHCLQCETHPRLKFCSHQCMFRSWSVRRFRMSMPSRSRMASKRCQGAERWTRIRSKECLEHRQHPAQQGFPTATRLTMSCRVPFAPDMKAIRPASLLLSACLLPFFHGKVDSETLIAATIKPLKLMD
jgi:hypothetical protein